MKQGNKTKSLILDAANKLFYRQGFNATSIAHIVEATGLSKGNITYHFSNKQAILEGIVKQRLSDIDTLLANWNKQFESPLERLKRFCKMLQDEQENLKNYGCPMGTLTGEFSKNQDTFYRISLPMFDRFLVWLTEQLTLLGLPSIQAREDAMALLSRVQGIAVITHVYKDKAFLNREVDSLIKEIVHKYG